MRGEHNSLPISDKIISADTIVNICDFEVLRVEVTRHDAIQTRPFGKITEVSILPDSASNVSERSKEPDFGIQSQNLDT